MELGLKNKVIVCLSSAAGIGRGIATELAREGAKVVITTAEPFKKDLDEAVAYIEKETGNRPYTYISDIKDPDSIVKLINDAAKDLGGIYGPDGFSMEPLVNPVVDLKKHPEKA